MISIPLYFLSSVSTPPPSSCFSHLLFFCLRFWFASVSSHWLLTSLLLSALTIQLNISIIRRLFNSFFSTEKQLERSIESLNRESERQINKSFKIEKGFRRANQITGEWAVVMTFLIFGLFCITDCLRVYVSLRNELQNGGRLLGGRIEVFSPSVCSYLTILAPHCSLKIRLMLLSLLLSTSSTNGIAGVLPLSQPPQMNMIFITPFVAALNLLIAFVGLPQYWRECILYIPLRLLEPFVTQEC